MVVSGKVFASSLNGDRWLLSRDEAGGGAQVVHEANLPSGGAVTRIEVADFLRGNPAAPEHSALLRFLGAAAEAAMVGLDKKQIPLAELRRASENEVDKALLGAKVTLPLRTSYEALEFFNCMLDVLTDQREIDEATDAVRIPVGFGSNH